MNTTPQAVTERYVSNLISYGRNREFDITSIDRQLARDGEEVVGVYYTVRIMKGTGPVTGDKLTMASAPTISLAVRRALEKHGVTFR